MDRGHHNDNKKTDCFVFFTIVSIPNFVLFLSFLFALGIVFSGWPVRVHLHVHIPLMPGHLVIFRLLVFGQCMPLQRRVGGVWVRRAVKVYLGRPTGRASVSFSWPRTYSYPGRSSEGTFVSASAAPFATFRNTWPVPPGSGRATVKNNPIKTHSPLIYGAGDLSSHTTYFSHLA